MSLAVPVERIVQRGLVRFQIRQEYERGFRLLSEPVLRRAGIGSFLTPHGQWLVAQRELPYLRERYLVTHGGYLSEPKLHPDDEKVIMKYAAEVHKMARKVALSFPKQEGTANGQLVINTRFRGHRQRFRAMEGTRFFTPFGLVRFLKLDEPTLDIEGTTHYGRSGPGSALVYSELAPSKKRYDVRHYLAWSQALGRSLYRAKNWRDEVQQTRSTFLHELEHLHYFLATSNFREERGLVSEVACIIRQAKSVKDKKAASWMWEYYKKKPSDPRFAVFFSLLKATGNLKLSMLQRKKLATILADPAVKRIEDAKMVFDHVMKNRHLLN